jgi:hypothetical protein
MTLAGSIKTSLASNWALTGDLASTKVHFADSGWFDSNYASYPQIVVTQMVEPIGGYYSSSLHLHPRFVVNCWLQIPRGANGTVESQYIEDMRYEVVRIINENRTMLGTNTIIIPRDAGIPRHELSMEPRILRFEIGLLGAQTK